MAQRDLLGECDVDHHPIDVFTRDCCANCINPECTRSLSGKAKFDSRTATWFERFFGDKDQMDPRDTRFPTIAGQKFILIDPGRMGRMPEIGSAWMDPRDIEILQPEPPAPPPVAEPPVEPRAALKSAPPSPAPSTGPRPQRELAHQLLLANAPSQTGRMVPAPPSASIGPIVVKDPWAVQPPDQKDDEPVVSPGARVKMGGGGV
jgi:hypothetical protein